MPDIDPAALSRPLISTTPILPPKTISSSGSIVPKALKISHVPPRIDLEPLYTALKSAIGEYWAVYKASIGLFVMGQLNQSELSAQIDSFLITPTGEIEHLHNQLIAAIYANVTREMPDHGVASWVSANDKPTTGVGSKPVSGDAAEQRLKTEVMALPSRDRRRIKDLTLNEFEPPNAYPNPYDDSRRPRTLKPVDLAPASAGGLLLKTNTDLEARKKYNLPLASETGEFPDVSTIEPRLGPMCHETGLNTHSPDAAQFMSVATETFIKEMLSSIFSKTRTNGPGISGSAGTGGGASWVQTHRYKTQLEKEEEAALRNEILRDKSGLLPIEAKAASERGPLSMADVRTALEIGDCYLGQMQPVVQQVFFNYREGEVEEWDEHAYIGNYVPTQQEASNMDIEMGGTQVINGINGHASDLDGDDLGWEGAEAEDMFALDNLLDSCLAIGS